MQSKVASLWHMQEAMKKGPASQPANGGTAHEDISSPSDGDSPDHLAGLPAKAVEQGSIKHEEPDLVRAPELGSHHVPESIATPEAHTMPQAEDAPVMATSTKALPESPSDEHAASEETALARPEAWASAASARDFLEQLAEGRPSGYLARLWNTHRGDIYLAIAVILAAVVVFRWGIWSDHSVSATANTPAAHRKSAPDADLSTFDRMLISLGLAEAPPPPESKGNPDAQVWVDLHTALYYCPGSDLYGKTPKGKYTTQRDAQLDQFGPAYGKACD
jgi:hypothetical protein